MSLWPGQRWVAGLEFGEGLRSGLPAGPRLLAVSLCFGGRDSPEFSSLLTTLPSSPLLFSFSVNMNPVLGFYIIPRSVLSLGGVIHSELDHSALH